MAELRHPGPVLEQPAILVITVLIAAGKSTDCSHPSESHPVASARQRSPRGHDAGYRARSARRGGLGKCEIEPDRERPVEPQEPVLTVGVLEVVAVQQLVTHR